MIEVKQLMRRSRGCELPETFNPLIIGELFVEQCEPWKILTYEAKETILESAYEVVAEIVNYITLPETRGPISQAVHRGLSKLETDLKSGTTKVLDP